METSSLKGLKHGEVSLVSRWTNECKSPGRAGHGRPRKDGMIIEVGLALVLWRQDLSNGWGQLARQKNDILMQGDKEFRGQDREKGINE